MLGSQKRKRPCEAALILKMRSIFVTRARVHDAEHFSVCVELLERLERLLVQEFWNCKILYFL
jgi:hypothetical protein